MKKFDSAGKSVSRTPDVLASSLLWVFGLLFARSVLAGEAAPMCDNSVTVTIDVCPTCTYKTLYDVWRDLEVQAISPATHPYSIRLSGSVKVGWAPICEDSGSHCGDDANWSWNVSGLSEECRVVIEALDAGNKPTLLRNTTRGPKSGTVLSISHAKFVTLRNLKIPDSAAGVSLLETDNVTIENSDFTIGSFDPVGGAGAINVLADVDDNIPIQSSNTRILNNTITYLDASESVLDEYWREDNEDEAGIPRGDRGKGHGHSFFHGIYLAHADGTVVTGNTIINAPGGGIHAFHNYTTNSAISNNTVRRCHHYGYQIPDARDPQVTDYTVDQHRWGVIIAGEKEIHDNTINGNHFKSSSKSAAQCALYDCRLDGSNDLVVIHDNSTLNNVRNNQVGNDSDWGDSSSCPPPQASTYQQRLDKRYNRAGTAVYRFVSGEIFVVQKEQGLVVKVSNVGGGGQNMFALDASYNGLPGYNYWMGTHAFKTAGGSPMIITAMTYVNGYTFIGFADGHLLKIAGTGGTGANMFHVTANTAGFANDPGFSYGAGSHTFLSGVRHIVAVNGFTFLTFENKKVLKVNGVGGGGSNLFAINEDASGFTTLPGYNYYSGDAVFLGKVNDIRFQSGYLFLAFDNKKILKINGAGGVGHNLFAITETPTAFASVSGYAYYSGHQTFSVNTATVLGNVNGDLVVGFDTGRVLKVAAVGGGGANMFCTADDASGAFAASPSSCGYFHGFDKFQFNNRPVTQILYIPGTPDYTLIGYADGELVKLSGTGGSTGIHILAGGRKSYLRSSITSLSYIDNQLFIATTNGNVLRMSDLSGNDDNPFGMYRDGVDFSPLRNTTYLTGSQVL